jgi:hypothetical protein
MLLQPFGPDEWYRFLPSSGTNADPAGVFKLVNGQLHVLDIPATNAFQEFGYVATTRDYSNYHLQLRYRWGDKRFAPRALEKRDSGVLYHVVGPDLIWPRSVECQIQEGDTGDIFFIDGTGATTTVSPFPTSGERQFAEGGVAFTQVDGRIVKGATVDSLTDWNNVEVIVTGSESVHIVNGTLVARMSSMTQPDPSDPTRRIPLTAGRILLQAEGAEIVYSDISLTEFSDFVEPPPDAMLLTNWETADGSVATHDGAWEICAGCGDVRTRERFQDFRLHVEYLVPPTPSGSPEQNRGNSGIYLQQRYELQVLDSYMAPLADANDAAAIYGLADASVNASRPAGTWQSYDVTFRAARFGDGAKIKNARVSVAWNGTPVHQDLELPGPTPGGAAETPEPGPILLQDHGHPVRYRNLWLQALDPR